MEDLLSGLLQNVGYEPPGWENEFYVGITKAAELSGLTESQIRYMEELPGIHIGKREGPNNRNRVYTKRDVRFLRWVYQCKDVRPAEIAILFKEHQDEILARLGDIVLPQVIERERASAGSDLLISRLVSVLMAFWLRAPSSAKGIQATQAISRSIQGVIFGPQEDTWKTSFFKHLKDGRAIDLANCLVAWVSTSTSIAPTDLDIFFSTRSWYLPFERASVDTRWLSDGQQPFSVVILWRFDDERSADSLPTMTLDEPRTLLSNMLMSSLKRALESVTASSGEHVSVFSRATPGPAVVSQGLALLLEHCIQPYFPECYAYVARFDRSDMLTLVEARGDVSAGYLPMRLDEMGTLPATYAPWWIDFARGQASIALEKNMARRAESRDEFGSVVCIPLIRQDSVVGVLGLENTRVEGGLHCLSSRDGLDGPALLRYLMCIAEIAADYLNLQVSSVERFERSQLAYTRDESVDWHWTVYQQGGLNYALVIEDILVWCAEVGVNQGDTLCIALIDIAKEAELAQEHKGFDIIVDIVEKTRRRILSALLNDAYAAELQASRKLVLYPRPVTDHLVLAALNVDRDYLHILLSRIKGIWRGQNDAFLWQGQEISVILQIGLCTFTGLAIEQRKMASEVMKHHLWEMAQQMFERQPLNTLLEYTAQVPTLRLKP